MRLTYTSSTSCNNLASCWAQWLTPAVPALGGSGGKMSSVREFDTGLASTGRPRLYKNKQLTRCGGVRLQSQVLRRLREENCLNPEGGGCGEPRSCHCTPVWVTTAKLHVKKKKNYKKKKKKFQTFIHQKTPLKKKVTCSLREDINYM